MASEIKANKISPATGTAFTLGDSGDTFTIPSGVTLTNNGIAVLALIAVLRLFNTLPVQELGHDQLGLQK